MKDKKPLSAFMKVLTVLIGSVLFLAAVALISMLIWIGVSLWDNCNCAAAFSCEDCTTLFSNINFSKLFGCNG